jgi:hypothetical protein
MSTTRRRLGGGYVTTPTLRKCRSCCRNHQPADLVEVAPWRDSGRYLHPLERWCPTCAAVRLEALRGDARCTEDADHLEVAIDQHAAGRATA